jgi:hypothetical protein
MEAIIAQLFAARDTAHRIHLRTRSFAAHIALNELYDELLEFTDELAETYQGKYGLQNIPNPEFIFTDHDGILFVRELSGWAEATRLQLNPADTYIINEWDTLLSVIYRAKYKLENLV